MKPTKIYSNEVKQLEGLSTEALNALFTELFKSVQNILSKNEGIAREALIASEEYTRVYNVQRAIANGNMALEIAEVLNDPALGELLTKQLNDFAELGYNGTSFIMEKQVGGVMAGFNPLINVGIAEHVINNGAKGVFYRDPLYKFSAKVAEQVQQALVQGVLNGQDSGQIAKASYNKLGMSYRQAKGVFVTEQGRVLATAQMEQVNNAIALGMTGEKEWISTHDHKTRKDHQHLDGQRVDMRDFFSVGSYHARAPHMFNVPSEDIRCRCDMVLQFNGSDAPIQKYDYADKDIKAENYKEWLARQE